MAFKRRMTLPVLRRLLVLGLAASLTACSSFDFKLPSLPHGKAKAPAAAVANGADRYAAREPGVGQWPQAVSDLAPDPDIRFGALPNGMRYAIQRNATPTGQVSLRLRFDAGSIDEADPEQGLAHLLEHMAFKGSTNVPEGQEIPTLERLGLAFGADTNASTSWDETIYQFDLPRNDEDSLSTGIKLMRETAGELTLAQSAIDSEKSVVLSEERLRDTPSYHVSKTRMDFLLAGQRAPTRFPIGKVDVIGSARSDVLKGLYQRYYRPERATLVVTGDMDPAAMETRIKAAFSNWMGTGSAGDQPPGGAIAQRGQQTRLAVEAGAASGVQLAWVQPAETGVNTKARVERDLTEALGFAVLNRRLQVLARATTPPFISAGGGRSDYFHEARVTSLQASFEPGAWKPALAAIDAEQRRLVQFGVRPDELAREITDWRAGLQAAVAGAATRRTPDLADTITDSIDARDIVTSPAQDLALFDQIVKSVTPAQVNAAIKSAFSGQGPLMFVSSPVAIEGGEAALT
ncbi:MAG: peptidase, partial [Caulobacteraceae bacterium]|nr:peptidase [Caulobacteraceae bacterium]